MPMDGLIDLATANQDSNELTVLLNRTCNNVLLGDVNGDGDVDSLDINSFVQLIISSQFECSADTNEDGVVDLLDVQSFVNLLGG